ncbi:MAG: hypothetical protein JJU41_08265 [Bacteroidetes bacterium]|nr:hypothetical protein [Bacteroidota bacterium]
MSENRPTHIDDDEIDLKELIPKIIGFIKHLWQEQRYIWFALLVTVPIGLLVAFGSTPEYTASTKILPYRSGGSGGGLSGLAGLAGVRLPAGQTEQLITVDMYPELAATLDFRLILAETPIRFSKLNEPVTPAMYFQEIAEPDALSRVKSYTIGLPGTILSALRSSFIDANPPSIQRIDSEDDPLKSFDEAYLRMLRTLGERLSVRANQTQRVTTSLTIEATMPDPVAAADMVRIASERLMQTVIDYEIRKVSVEIRFLEEQYQRSKIRYEAAQEALALFTDRNRGTLSATAQIEAQRLQSEFNLALEIYRNFTTELEQARIKQNRDTPIFTVLESVTVPNNRSTPRRGLTLILSMILGVFFGVVVIFAKLNIGKAYQKV